ncbi:Nuclear transport factor 2, eukaryote,NTF2-like domain, partial [Cinara cedri]
MSAAEVGFRFAQHYDSMLNTNPQDAFIIYDKLGDYRTIYEDGTLAIAKKRKELERIVITSVTSSNISVNLLYLETGGHSVEHLLIMVIGERFRYVISMDCRPNRGMLYAIVRSVMQYFSVNQPTQVTTFNVAYDIQENTDNHKIEATSMTQADISNNVAAYNNPLSNTIKINTYNAIKNVQNPTKSILKGVKKITEIATTSQISNDTVMNDANYEKSTNITLVSVRTSASEIGFRFAQIYYATLSTKPENAYLFYNELGEYRTTYEDGTSNKKEQLSFTMSAAEVGFRFAQHYNSMLSFNPQDAFIIYDKLGDNRTIYEDDTSANAKNRKEIERIVITSATSSNISVHLLYLETGGHSVEHLSIMVIGERFRYVFSMDCRPNRGMLYAIVRSVMQYFSVNQPTQVTTFDVGYNIEENTDYHKIEAISMTQADISNNVVTYNDPLRNTIKTNTYNAMTNVKNQPKSILKSVTESTEIASTSQLSNNTVKNDANYEKTANKTFVNVKTRATEVGIRFAQNYYARLTTKPENAYLFYDQFGDYRTIYEDGTSVLVKNRKEIKSVLLNHVTIFDIAVKLITSEPVGGSLEHLVITVTGVRFKHVFFANYRTNRGLRYAIVNSVKQYFFANQQTQVTSIDIGDNIAENTDYPETAGKKQIKISVDITTYNKPSCNARNINTYNTNKIVKNPPMGILKRVTSYTNITDTFIPSRDNLKINPCNAMTIVKNTPRDPLKSVTKSTEIDTTSKQSKDIVNNDANYEKTANKNLVFAKTSATDIGFKFAQFYYAILSTKPQNAYLSYDELGEYRTISEDGTFVLARNWNKIKSALLNPANLSNIFIKSITRQPVSGSLENLLITVTGVRIRHVFIANKRPNRGIGYAIGKSVKQYFPANQKPQVTTFAAGDNIAENANNHEPLEKKQANFLDDIDTNNELSCNAGNINTYNAIKTVKNTPKGVLKRVTIFTEIATAPKHSHYTVNNGTNHEITVISTLEGILKRRSKSTELPNTSKLSHNPVNNNANNEISAKYPRKGILNHVSSSTEIATTSISSCDTVNNDAKQEITANNNSNDVKASATEVGFEFAQRYYATLETEKDLAYLFYEEHGDYRTIYEDGTSVLAKNWEEINNVILSPSTFSDIFVKSITTEPCGGSLDELLITVIGIRFKHQFFVDYRPNREQNYVIVKSVKQYFPEDHPTQDETFAASDIRAENTGNHEPAGKKQEIIFDDIVTHDKP